MTETVRAIPRPDGSSVLSRDSVLREMCTRVADSFQPLRIILFGSRARGVETAGSDYDVLVIMPEGVDRRATTVAIRRRLADLPGAKDIVVTTAADLERGRQIAGTIADEASREGVDLYVR